MVAPPIDRTIERMSSPTPLTSSDLVTLQVDGGIARLTLNRPEALNALSLETAERFAAQCDAIERDARVRVVVLRGAGKAFGVGGDVSALTGADADFIAKLIDAMHRGVRVLARIDAPVIAGLHGAVAGGSLSLAAACDLAIAAEGTRFNLAYTNLGANCDVGGSWSLPRLIGMRRAMQVALLSDTFDAAEALRIGLINQVVPADQLDAAVDALAQRLAQGPTLAYGRMKRRIRKSFDNDLATQLDAERDNFKASSHTEDFAEGTAAFMAKRKPRFKGR